MTTNITDYHIEYLAEMYERLQDLSSQRKLITENKVEQMRKAFMSYDKDGNGVLDKNEIVELLTVHFKEEGMKRKPTAQDVQDFFDALDKDHSGEI